MLAFVLALAFALLLVAFRSIVVPLKAIALNLLSVGAAYGVLALVFQHHWAEPILGFHSERHDRLLAAALPLRRALRALDGLPRLHPQPRPRSRRRTASQPTTAVRRSIAVTAGVVTAAAVVMVCVFALFGTLSSLELKQAGVGLAAAVLIDATLIRGVLLPATMKLLGDANWYLPRRLQWLPRLAHEPPDTPGAAPALARPAHLTRACREPTEKRSNGNAHSRRLVDEPRPDYRQPHSSDVR